MSSKSRPSSGQSRAESIATPNSLGPPPVAHYQPEFLVELTHLRNKRGLCTIQAISDAPNEKINKMELQETLHSCFFKKRTSPTFDNIHVDDHFLGRWDGEDALILRRVKVLKIEGMVKKVQCVDIDNGENAECSWYNLSALESEALEHPRQNFDVFIPGLEVLHGSRYFLQSMDKPPQRYLMKIIEFRGKIPAVEFYYEGDPPQPLIEVVYDRIRTIFALPPAPIGEMKKVVVTHVLGNGEFCFQYEKSPCQPISQYLGSKDLKQTRFEAAAKDAEDVKLDAVYICRFGSSYYRAKVVAILEEDKVLVEYIDFGNEEVVAIKGLFKADVIHKLLSLIPSQCISAKLTGIEHIEKPDCFWDMVPEDQVIMVQIDSYPEVGTSLASLFLQMKDGEVGECLNHVMMQNGSALAHKKQPNIKHVEMEVKECPPEPEPIAPHNEAPKRTPPPPQDSVYVDIKDDLVPKLSNTSRKAPADYHPPKSVQQYADNKIGKLGDKLPMEHIRIENIFHSSSEMPHVKIILFQVIQPPAQKNGQDRKQRRNSI